MSGETATTHSLAVEAFGVTVEITAEARHLSAVRAILPPGATPATEPPPNGRFTLVPTAGRDLLTVHRDAQALTGAVDAAVALGVLDAQVRMHIALHAPEHIFVHAGVVGVANRAIVLPGKSFAGKTTLVASLVKKGATYWSDEYAALDSDGLVHPYAKPLSVRMDPVSVVEERTIESLGGQAGDRPLRVRLVAVTHYRPGASWAPRLCSAGEGAIRLLEHTVPAQSRPEQALDAVRRAVTNAVILEGERGEAEEMAAALMLRAAE